MKANQPAIQAAIRVLCERMFTTWVMLVLACTLSACGGSGGGSSDSDSDVSGSGVKGPLVNATVNVYEFDSAATDFIGTLIDSGETDQTSAITGITLTPVAGQVVVLEIIADGDTIDLTTGAAPIITRLLTVVTSADLVANPVFPSPLTTVAFRLAGTRGDSPTAPYAGDNNGTLSGQEMLAAFVVASRQVNSTLGFGMPAEQNLNATPPLITAATVTNAEQLSAAQYRTGIEALAAVIANMQAESETNNVNTAATPDRLLAGLAEDLIDGQIDGRNNGVPIAVFVDIANVATQVTVDPATLVIPNTNPPINVSDVEDVLVSEKSSTGATTSTTNLENDTVSHNPAPARTEPDSDDDGVLDKNDNCQTVANPGQENNDGDALGDACDPDRDGDGTNNDDDAFPDDPNEQFDSDNDGIGNAADDDDDGDKVPDVDDAFPLDPTESQDMDEDGVGNNSDPDTDGDGQNNDVDADDDNDGVPDTDDELPRNPDETLDTDGDGIGNNTDDDIDGDDINNDVDDDDDGDNVPDGNDAFPKDPNETTDTDGDGVGNNADNCPADSNPGQEDSDGDGIGNVCDDGGTGGGPGGSNELNWDSSNWNESDWQ